MFKSLKNYFKYFNKSNLLTKIYIILVLVFIIFYLKKILKNDNLIEKYNNLDNNLYKKNFFEKKYNNDIYDDLYAHYYDYAHLNEKKNNEEIIKIKKYIDNFKNPKILDVGCGTGFHVNKLNTDYDIIGIDKSKSMIKMAKSKYPDCKFYTRDFLNNNVYDLNTFTHILCLNRTIYNIDNKEEFFENCSRLLTINGYLIINFIDINNINSFINIDNNNSKNLFNGKSLGYYPKTHIIKFSKDIEFMSNFSDENLKSNNEIIYYEKLKNYRTNSVRKNEISLKINSIESNIKLAKKYNLIIKKVIELPNFKNEFLYIFIKK